MEQFDLNAGRGAAIEFALRRANEIGGPYQEALLRVYLFGTIGIHRAGMPDEAVDVFVKALAVLVAGERPDPIVLVDNHTKLVDGLADSVDFLEDN